MTVTSEYRGAYPLPGNVILLCEGDLIGYETALLRRWTAERVGTAPLVDILPCGTASAVFGMSDALGRSRPVMVIEDRDFRTVDEAATDCERQKRNREDRGVTVAGWKAWRRNEIENYFLELEVVLPVMAEWFACSDDHVRETLADLLPSLAIYQATEYALYRVRRQWTSGDPSAVLRNNLEHRPTWVDETRSLDAPGRDAVVTKLRENIGRWQEFVTRNGNLVEPFIGRQLLDDFGEKSDAWLSTQLDDHIWQVDWAGKEILHWLRIAMSANYGWRDPETGNRQKLQWSPLNRRQREVQDRAMERGMRRDMVARLLEYLNQDEKRDVAAEWIDIANTLRLVTRDPTPR